jgi:hypothetical protein
MTLYIDINIVLSYVQVMGKNISEFYPTLIHIILTHILECKSYILLDEFALNDIITM